MRRQGLSLIAYPLKTKTMQTSAACKLTGKVHSP